jgi:hypothetical protein
MPGKWGAGGRPVGAQASAGLLTCNPWKCLSARSSDTWEKPRQQALPGATAILLTLRDLDTVTDQAKRGPRQRAAAGLVSYSTR